MSRWFWWLGPPLIALALVVVLASRPLAIEIAMSNSGNVVRPG
jgi:hypothetical protein